VCVWGGAEREMRMGEIRNASIIFVGKPLGRPRCRWEIILRRTDVT
jgi:hypothetical protein